MDTIDNVAKELFEVRIYAAIECLFGFISFVFVARKLKPNPLLRH